MRLARFGSRILRGLMQIGRGRIADLRASVDLPFEPNPQAATPNHGAARITRIRTPHLKGKLKMKRFGSGLLGEVVKAAAVAAVLILSVSAGQAEPRPFTGFDGVWSGNGTVSLSDGTTERIRCRADYKVSGTGQGLKQTLRCASDSYKFDLSSDVTSQGDRISCNWNEASRNIFGNLQGTAGGGRIDVLVEAPGFTANLMMRTNGNRQTVQISSKGDIRGVSITMVKG
jgi:hypothetical protein